MKNQSDLIVTIVAVLCMLIGVGVCYGMKKEAVKPAPPEKAVSTPLAMPQATVVMASSLPGGGGGGGGRGAFGGPGGRPGMGGFGPPPGAVPGGGGGKMGGGPIRPQSMSGGGGASDAPVAEGAMGGR